MLVNNNLKEMFWAVRRCSQIGRNTEVASAFCYFRPLLARVVPDKYNEISPLCTNMLIVLLIINFSWRLGSIIADYYGLYKSANV